MKRIFVVMALMMLSIGMLTFAFNVQHVRSASLIRVPDDYPTIQDAINAANEGDTVWVRSGTYTEYVDVNKMGLTLGGESKFSTFIESPGTLLGAAAVNVTADSAVVMGFTIRNIDGIAVQTNSSNCYIIGNIITSDTLFGIVSAKFADHIRIINNMIYSYEMGILLNESNFNVVDGNYVSNSTTGINLDPLTQNNLIVHNTIENNTNGMTLTMTHAATIYHNNFINNANQVVFNVHSEWNAWDNGLFGGNYWSDYTGVDEKSGALQDEPGSDGLGDTPWILDTLHVPPPQDVDYYPLMGPLGPWSNRNNTSEEALSIISNSTISDLQFDGAEMIFSASGEPGTIGFCRLTIQHSMLLPPFTIRVDGNPISYATIFENETLSLIYFTYQHSTHQVEIASALRDVAVTDVSAPADWTYQGWTVSINVTAVNLGEATENFTVKLYYDSTLISTTYILNLTPNATIDLHFAWNTAGVAYCHNYTLKALASTVPNEANTTNNEFVDGQVKVRIFGDVNGDGTVEMLDFFELSNAYGSYPTHPRWDAACDLDQDGTVEMLDFYLVGQNFGKHC
jgi:parallel beta-helix repeat protein